MSGMQRIEMIKDVGWEKDGREHRFMNEEGWIIGTIEERLKLGSCGERLYDAWFSGWNEKVSPNPCRTGIYQWGRDLTDLQQWMENKYYDEEEKDKRMDELLRWEEKRNEEDLIENSLRDIERGFV